MMGAQDKKKKSKRHKSPRAVLCFMMCLLTQHVPPVVLVDVSKMAKGRIGLLNNQSYGLFH